MSEIPLRGLGVCCEALNEAGKLAQKSMRSATGTVAETAASEMDPQREAAEFGFDSVSA
jgi:hypothetical protein